LEFSPVFFDEPTLRKLDQLSLVAARVRAGQMKGERRSTKRGSSLEFADYRDYVRGDDLRRVDWNAYARLERPFIKLFEEEEDLSVHVLVDASRSMNWPDESPGGAEATQERNKFQYVIRLAAALGHIALAAGDRLTVAAFHGGSARPIQFGPLRGRGNTFRLIKFLSELAPEGTTDLNNSLRDYAMLSSRAGLGFLLTDLFSPGGYQPGLNALQSQGYELALLHVLAPEEIDPPLAGDLRLLDSETHEPQDVSVDGSLRDLYKRRVQGWRDEIEATCLKRGVHYVPVTTATKWDEVVLYQMRKLGLVK
jgi:uncharacterized protein (DUF58 family)